jgi:hypothetical protein
VTSTPERDLTEGARVHLDLGGAGPPIPCTVLAFLGPVILARHEADLAGATAERLASGAAGYLLVGQDRDVKALRGSARTAGERTLALHISDGFQLGQRRESTRIEVVLDARLTPERNGATPISTTTIDVSLGGVQVKRPAGTPVWPRYELTLCGGPLSEPVVAGVAPARALPDSLALRFTRIEAADRQRLIELVVTHVTERGARSPD